MEGPDDVKVDKKSENADLRHEGDKEYKPKHKHIFDEQQEVLEAAKIPTGDNAANTNGTVASKSEDKPTTENGVTEKPAEATAPAPPPAPAVVNLPWPSAADLNKRFRMIIAAYQRIFRRAQARAQRMLNRKPPRQITERWTKREESDFYRAVSTFGTECASNGQFKWDRFRLVAKLDKKSDVSLTNYYIAFRAMCERTCRRSTIPEEELPAVYVEQISEDRASRTLLRIHLLDRIRRECLSHPNLEKRLKLCQPSSDMPAWWVPGKHDKELLMGMNRHGLSRCEIHILNDKEFSFGECQEKANQPAPKIIVKGKDKPIEIKSEEDENESKPETEKENESEAKSADKSPEPAKSPEKEDKPEEKSEEMEVDKEKEPEGEKPAEEIEKPAEDSEKKSPEQSPQAEKSPEKSKTPEPTDEKENEEPKETEKPKTPEAKVEEKKEKVEEPKKSPEPKKEADAEKEKESEKKEEKPTVGVIEVENEEQKVLVEAELAKQQAANRWPKDKFLMQRAEHVCFCITQGKCYFHLYIAIFGLLLIMSYSQ